MDDGLRPCPFCGGEAELKRYQSGDWQVICYHADGCIMLDSDLDNCYWENVQTLARQWNTRAERTCHETTIDKFFRGCDSCGWMWEVFYSFGKRERPKYCPNCGAKVVGE